MGKNDKSMTMEELFQDMKQYIDAKFSGAFSMQSEEIHEKFETFSTHFDKKLAAVEERLMDHTSEVAQEILGAVAETAIPRLDNYEARIIKLESDDAKHIGALTQSIA